MFANIASSMLGEFIFPQMNFMQIDDTVMKRALQGGFNDNVNQAVCSP